MDDPSRPDAPTLNSRHRHKYTACSCRATPANWREIMRTADPRISELVLDTFERVIWGYSGHSSRTHSNLSPPDDFGHVYWLGAKPRSGRPRVMLEGERMDVVRYARILAGLPDFGPVAEYRQRCDAEGCYAAAHWEQPSVPAHRSPGFSASELERVFLLRRPRPRSPSLFSWGFDARTNEPTCPLDHPVKVHYSARRPSAYCPTCYQTLKDWQSDYKAYQAHLQRVTQGYERLTDAEQATVREAVRASGEAEAQRTRGQIEIESFPIPENSGETGGLTA